MPIEIVVPAMGESIVEATIAEWRKKPGDSVQAGEEIVELETDKVNQTIPAEASGILTEIKRQVGDTVTVGEVLAIITEGSANGVSATAKVPEETKVAPVETAAPTNGHAAPVTPLAKTVAADKGVDLASVEGSGVGGRIVAGDVTKAATPAPVPVATPAALPPVRPVPVSTASGRPEERSKMSRKRQVIAANLVMAQQTAAMLTTFNEIDMSAVMDLRKRRKESFEKQFGIGIGFMSFFSKAVLGALKQFPYLNAEIQGDEVVVKKYYDIGIAVSVEDGLVVPIVRDADKLSFAGIEKKIKELAEKARDGKLSLSELQGGTFTITNGGVFGSLMSTPILNYPQVGILGMHTIQERPVARNGEVVIRPMMYVALSYDHRIVDGSTSVRFLAKVKQLVEDPEALLLEG